ncbi:T9SS type A sorting domain-containing protein [Flavobacterium sp.]|uniref:T9SS type A sorting domain-containing protein n=1 Tax=Flavobacterium sp. TaxID=239 RepID=UPI002630D423|nr:T9SS type A sorting domain-containing protein [Flavobacterium sp.]
MKKKITLLVLFIAFQMNAQCWQMVSSGRNHSLGIKSDGTLWAWGRNVEGQLGTGNTTNQSLPIQVGTATNWRFVNAGFDTSFAIKTDGTLWAWGFNEFARIGDGTETNRLSPIQIGTDNRWVSVDSRNHTVAIKTDGTLWTWGFNSTGQKGDGTQSNTVYMTTPVQVGTDTNWQTACARSDGTLAIKTDGTLWSWGHNSNGQLGLGHYGTRLVPNQVGTDTDWQKIAAGGWHSLAIKTNGTLWAWGKKDMGQVGDGTTALTGGQTSPLQIGTATDWNAISASRSHSIAIKTGGTLWSWGENTNGQLGDGTNVARTSPVQVGNTTNWLTPSTKGYTSFALKNDGNLSACGLNTSGQLGDGTIVNKNTPTAIACPVALSTEDFSATTFSVYPNPSRDFLNIKNNMNLSIDTISIMDLTGKKVLEQKGTNSPVNVQPLANGIYMIQITSEGRSFQNKFIKS